jgi:ankyrin repeat protein
VKCDTNDKCSDDDKDRNTPLIYAARYGNMEVVRVLLEGGSNVDRTDVHGNTALHWAAWFGHVDVRRLLLDWGAKVDPVNWHLNTPLNPLTPNLNASAQQRPAEVFKYGFIFLTLTLRKKILSHTLLHQI